MKTLISLIILILTMGFSTLKAQEDGKNMSKIQNHRIAFYTQRIGLTTAEAEKFWPLYNEYTGKKDQLLTEKKKITNFYKNNSETMTENDIDVTIQKYVNIAKQETALFEDYNTRFRKILPASKVLKLYLAENEFKEWLIKTIRTQDLKGKQTNP